MEDNFDFEEYMEQLRSQGQKYNISIDVTNPMALLAVLPDETIEIIYQTNLETENYEFCQIIKEFREKKKSACKTN